MFMKNMNGFQNGLYEGRDPTCFWDLKCLHIENLGEIKYVVDATVASCEDFHRLEILELHSLHKLQQISHGNLLGGLFGDLQKLTFI